MPVIIGSARISENGTISGNRGDQTGNEVAQEPYYAHRLGWNVLRCIDPNKALMMSYDMASACNNSAFGYSQPDRDSGLYESMRVGYDTAKVSTPCNVDCSSLVRVCLAYAGYDVGDFYTGNEYDVIMSTGDFRDVTDTVNQSTGEGLYSGDILVTKQKGHTVIVTSGKDPIVKPTEHIDPYPVNEGEVAVYRMYHAGSGEHFLTANIDECNVLLTMDWNSEGAAFVAPKESDEAVFRMCASKHTYVTSLGELHILVENGWKFEGIAFHSGGNVPVFRLYNRGNGDHLFTISESERDMLSEQGWQYEGIAFYALR